MQEQLQALEPQMLSQPGETALKIQALLESARRRRDVFAEAYALCLLGGCAFFQDDYQLTITYAEQSLNLCRAQQFQELEARNANALGLASWRLGRLSDALEHFYDSLATAREEDYAGRSRVFNNLAAVYSEMDDYERALQHFQDAVKLAEKGGEPAYGAGAIVGMADTFLLLGRPHESLALLPRVKALAEQYQIVRVMCQAYQVEALAFRDMGYLHAALSSVEEGMKWAEQSGDAEAQALLQWILATVKIAQGDAAQSRVALEATDRLLAEADSAGDQSNQPILRSNVALSWSDLYQLETDSAQAFAALKEHLRLKDVLTQRSRMLQREAVTRQLRIEMLQREAQNERQRNVELLQANEKLRDTQAELSYRASHDTLTGLLNRSAFWAQTEQLLQQRSPEKFAGIIFVDIDYLKSVNDTHGHAMGDALIVEMARRFQTKLRAGDLIGRLSGDEFMIYLPQLSQPEDVELVARKLIYSLHEPLVVDGMMVQPAASMGVVVAPLDGTELKELHHHADLALYIAKQQGRNTWARFEAGIGASEKRRRFLKEELRSALALSQFELHYQPQFTMDRELVGVEGLLRWRHPQLGWVSPAEFVPLAEESMLIVELGQWVLEEGCRQAQRWGFAERGLVMSLNVSVRQFERPDFVQRVGQALRTAELPGDCLVLELTETMLHQESQTSETTVEALHHLGVRIAIDDFGTGYSSLRLLKQLPFRQLKIDRSFVSDLTATDEQYTSARHFMEVMLNLAHGLGMRVVAEGVETQEQFDLLREMGCDKAQGYLLARPLSAADLREQFLTPAKQSSAS